MGAAVAGWRYKRWALGLAGLALVIPLSLLMVIGMFAAMLGGLAGEMGSDGTFSPSAGALNDIPAEYLAIYQATGKRYGLDWAYLAAIGSIETNHGRLRAPGVKSGVNAYGCCAGPMQFMITGSGGGTWGAYGVDGNGDGKQNVYDPADAIPAAAKYLKASGAPKDWPRAIFAYNHAGWYVQQVQSKAARYRGAALSAGGPLAGNGVAQELSGDGKWLMRVPGTNAVCDRRIVTDVVWLLERYRMSPGDCFAPTGHKAKGEHPLGLGIDLVPGRGGNWSLLDKAARDLGWRPACAPDGCEFGMPPPFRVILWNGYPGHGDPAHVGPRQAHLHLSWDHSEGNPARTVKTLLRGNP